MRENTKRVEENPERDIRSFELDPENSRMIERYLRGKKHGEQSKLLNNALRDYLIKHGYAGKKDL